MDNQFDVKALTMINACADFLVTITGCNKADALKAIIKIYADENKIDLSPVLDIIPAWIEPKEGTKNE